MNAELAVEPPMGAKLDHTVLPVGEKAGLLNTRGRAETRGVLQVTTLELVPRTKLGGPDTEPGLGQLCWAS